MNWQSGLRSIAVWTKIFCAGQANARNLLLWPNEARIATAGADPDAVAQCILDHVGATLKPVLDNFAYFSAHVSTQGHINTQLLASVHKLDKIGEMESGFAKLEASVAASNARMDELERKLANASSNG